MTYELDFDQFMIELRKTFKDYCLAKEEYKHRCNNYSFVCRTYPNDIINQALLDKTKSETQFRNASDNIIELYNQYELLIDISTNRKNAGKFTSIY